MRMGGGVCGWEAVYADERRCMRMGGGVCDGRRCMRMGGGVCGWEAVYADGRLMSCTWDRTPDGRELYPSAQCHAHPSALSLS
jgi:hypothetical protein